MRITYVHVAVAALALALAAGSAAAAPVGGQDLRYTIEGQQIEGGHGTDQVGADARAKTDDLELGATAPMCDVDVKADSKLRSCEGPKVGADTGAPALNVNVFVGFGKLENAPTADAGYVDLNANAYRQVQAAPATILIATAAAGAGAALLYAAWRVLKLAGFAGLIPLYSQIPDNRILDDPNRAQIMKLVREEPGVSTKELAERLGLAWGTVTHHLTKLEKRRFIVSKKYGKYRRYFVNGAAPPEGGLGDLIGSDATDATDAGFGVAAPAARPASAWKDALAVLRVEKTAIVAQFIRDHPGFTQKDVSEALGVSSSTILWHVKRLERVGLVTKIRDGKMVRYFPGSAMAAAPTDAASTSIVPA